MHELHTLHGGVVSSDCFSAGGEFFALFYSEGPPLDRPILGTRRVCLVSAFFIRPADGPTRLGPDQGDDHEHDNRPHGLEAECEALKGPGHPSEQVEHGPSYGAPKSLGWTQAHEG